jgi:branched-chain amino acid transport system permease protein
VSAFATSAAVTGVAGALSAHQLLAISPSLYGPQQSLIIILFCVFGGVRYFWGAAAGAIVLSLLPVYFSSLADWYNILYGALFVVLMIVRPQGLIGRISLPHRLRRPWRPVESSPALTEQAAGKPVAMEEAKSGG